MTVRVQEDIETINNILKGDEQSEKILYVKYKESVCNFLKKKYSKYNDIEDDVSEIMIKVFTKLNKFDSSKSMFSSWVFTIATNHMIDKWRSTTISLTGSNTNCVYSYSSTPSTSDISFETTNTSISDVSGSYTSSLYCIDTEFENCSTINYLSEQLNPQDYTMLDMKYNQGYSYDEIGSEFNSSSVTISNKVNYIKSKLKKNNPEIID